MPGAGSPDGLGANTGSNELKCGQGLPGFGGLVFMLPESARSIPDFSTMKSTGVVNVTSLDIPVRNWSGGFPALPSLLEFFGIAFYGAINLPADGTYQFKTTSDDGSNLYIDGKMIVNNDGQHAPVSRESSPVTLTKGPHKIRIDWYQGPREQIALQVFWKTPANMSYTIIDNSLVTHDNPCDIQNIGSFP